MEITTQSTNETKSIGRKMASRLKGGEVIALTGNLGSGKTTFVQGLAEGLGIEGRIVSPTFIILRKYQTKEKLNLIHVDLYRLEENIEEELLNLGFDEMVKNERNVTVIEWSEKLKSLPEGTISINFEYLSDSKRIITSHFLSVD